MADQKINALPTKTAPVTGDKCLMSGAAEEYLIDYDKLATAILNKLTSKTFTLDQGTKTLIAAINELNSKTQNNPIEYFPTTEANFPKYCYEHIEQNSTKAFYVSTTTENKLDKYIPGNAGGTATCIRGASIMTIVYITVNRDLYIGAVSTNSVDTGGTWKSYDGAVYNFD